MERRLDELHGRLQQQRDAEAARADAGDGQPVARITYISDQQEQPNRVWYQIAERGGGDREGGARTDPMIQMMAPTMETRTARSAKGRPSRNPSGRHPRSRSPSPPPQQQHIFDLPLFPFTFSRAFVRAYAWGEGWSDRGSQVVRPQACVKRSA
jgi:hypothetical protein